ncbi:MAG: hypothetical protein KJ048_07330 [Dehalococcoidia bacterium]|nr:hypothetical protein [Dehalococcoidia bacterium]
MPNPARFEACARILPPLLALAIGKLAPELILVVLPGGQHRVGLEFVAEACGTFNEREEGRLVFLEREAVLTVTMKDGALPRREQGLTG